MANTIHLYIDSDSLRALDFLAKTLGVGRGAAITYLLKSTGNLEGALDSDAKVQAQNIEFLLGTLDWMGGITWTELIDRAIILGITNVNIVLGKLISSGQIRQDHKLYYRPRHFVVPSENVWCLDLLEWRRENGPSSFFDPAKCTISLPQRFAPYVLAAIASQRQQIDSSSQDSDTPELPPASSAT